MQAEPEVQSEPKKPPRQYPLCALLLSDSNMEFTRKTAWSGGPELYESLLTALKAALENRGVEVEFVSEPEVADGLLRHYRVLFIVETYSITAQAEESIRHFVEHGGVLVGINEVGRFQGKWTKPWHYEDIFGVKALAIDEYGTAPSGGQDLFNTADLSEVGKSHELTSEFGDHVKFGDYSEALWVTQPTTARVLAWFSPHMWRTKAAGSVASHESMILWSP